ncbi:metal-dependent hydrolase [Halonotius terrestris]|uniref:Metal-dependent hydrolase n=1 Tax=Halonotius terrestris TaxID=2487750 RepID=A0A8J8PD88_9EURY|nr:metal-dependent hydrolase [Halonotius terrestris]TQQ83241.1 metal-dependent hydrolase [Halonotius terrestris]
MYRKGHLGVSMLVFAPVGYWLVAVGEPEPALLTGAVMLWLAMLPDIDHRLPVIEHRGVTHSLLFAGLIGGLFGAVGIVISGAFSVAGVSLGVFGFLLGALTVGAHLVGDMLTPAGVPLLWPLPQTYSLSLTRADNTVANYGLFAVGIVVTGGWAAVAFGVA